MPSYDPTFAGTERILLLADEMLSDIIGFIVYVGRVHREQTKVPGIFAESRWVGLILQESQAPIALKLYTCSRGGRFHQYYYFPLKFSNS